MMFYTETTLKGLPLSEGVAVARICLFNENRHSSLPTYKLRSAEIEAEIARAKRAFRVAADRLEALHGDVRERIGPAEAEIFVAQKMLMQDAALSSAVFALVRDQSVNAEAAVTGVLDEHEARLLEVDDEYIKERSTDFGEVKRRLLDVLTNMSPSLQCGDQKYCQKGRDRIVVAEELTPTLTVGLDSGRTMGFVTERGGVNSHAAILAKALAIPAVSGIAGIRDQLTCGDEALINGYTGEVIISPRPETVSRVRAGHGTLIRAPKPIEPVSGFSVMANISCAAEADLAAEMMADGVGLYRTEFELLTAGRLLDEDEQYARYASVVEAMHGLPVTFRLFDIGGDKPVPFVETPAEENPQLGWRGLRLLLDREELLQTQARALVRASAHGIVNVLYPMVVDLDQFRAVRSVFNQAVDDAGGHSIKHGVMFEVPSACLQAHELLAEADFGSIGTNDLIQYLFAVDRNNERVAYDYKPGRPALWSLIRDIRRIARDVGKPLSVCGELAGDPKWIAQVLDAGIETVSVSPRLIPGVRLAVLKTRRAETA